MDGYCRGLGLDAGKLGFLFWNMPGMQTGATCFFAFPLARSLVFWTAYEATVQRGCICIPGGGRSTESRLRSVLENKVEYLFCTPTYAMRMIETAKEIEIDLTKNSLKKIIVAGECGGSIQAVRRSVDEAWGKRLFDLRPLWDDRGGSVAAKSQGTGGGLRSCWIPTILRLLTENYPPSKTKGNWANSSRLRWVERALRSYDIAPEIWFGSHLEWIKVGFPSFDLVGGILGQSMICSLCVG